MKIIQIVTEEVVNSNGVSNTEILGLGDDGKVYIYVGVNWSLLKRNK